MIHDIAAAMAKMQATIDQLELGGHLRVARGFDPDRVFVIGVSDYGRSLVERWRQRMQDRKGGS